MIRAFFGRISPYRLLGLTIALLAQSVASAQEPAGKPIPAGRSDSGPSVGARAPSERPETPPPPGLPDFGGSIWTRAKLTGDWFGYRTDLAGQGITLDASITQFYQGVTNGGNQRDFRYGGKLDYFLNVDGEKAGLWKGFFITMHAETRYGRDVNNIDGLILPSNINMLFPVPNQDITAITSLKFVQALSENFAVFGGKLNMLDEYQPLIGGGGRGEERFMNTSLAFNPIPLRQIPYSTYAAGFVIMKDQFPLFNFMVFDPVDQATRFGQPFAEGAGLNAEVRLPMKPFGLFGYHTFGGAWTNREFTAVDRESFALVPGQGIVAGTKAQSWSLYYGYNQYLWMIDPEDPKRGGWGFFTNLGLADGNPSPVRWSANAGLQGNNPMRCRQNDTFGAGFFYLGISQDFKTLLNGPVFGQRDEYGGEVFYNVAVTPWCHFTADLQVARPSTERFNTAVVPGIRLKIDF